MKVKTWSLAALSLLISLGPLACARNQEKAPAGSETPAVTSVSNPVESPKPDTCEVTSWIENSELTCAAIDPEKEESVLLDQVSVKTAGRVMVTDQILQTLSDSMAQLQFNEGSLAKAGYETTFEFRPNLNGLSLTDGEVLKIVIHAGVLNEVEVASEPMEELGVADGDKPLSVITEELKAESGGTAYVVRRDAEQKRTEVFSLTRSPVRVSANGETVELTAGESVAATTEGLEEVEPFNLCQFYETEAIVAGLGPDEEDIVMQKSPSAQLTYYAVRAETIAAYLQLCPRVVTRTVVRRVCPSPP